MQICACKIVENTRVQQCQVVVHYAPMQYTSAALQLGDQQALSACIVYTQYSQCTVCIHVRNAKIVRLHTLTVVPT